MQIVAISFLMTVQSGQAQIFNYTTALSGWTDTVNHYPSAQARLFDGVSTVYIASPFQPAVALGMCLKPCPMSCLMPVLTCSFCSFPRKDRLVPAT